jgi:hypothetical protein
LQPPHLCRAEIKPFVPPHRLDKVSGLTGPARRHDAFDRGQKVDRVDRSPTACLLDLKKQVAEPPGMTLQKVIGSVPPLWAQQCRTLDFEPQRALVDSRDRHL